jgi:hypothetical protein
MLDKCCWQKYMEDGVSGALIHDLMWDGKDISEAPKSGFHCG